MANAYAALALAIRVSPNGKVGDSFVRLFNDMHVHGEPEENIVLALIEATADGLRHGNWPSV